MNEIFDVQFSYLFSRFQDVLMQGIEKSSDRKSKAKESEFTLSAGPIQWSDDEEDEEDESEKDAKANDSDSEEEGKHLTKQEKRKNEEVHIRGIEKRMRDDEAPETTEEYDRLLMQNPNSSFLWIKYMAFMLSRGEEERARQIAEVF
jgi:rRNA biogenesis protein RRP5